jgi:hypothetical protein
MLRPQLGRYHIVAGNVALCIAAKRSADSCFQTEDKIKNFDRKNQSAVNSIGSYLLAGTVAHMGQGHKSIVLRLNALPEHCGNVSREHAA